jgi:hypothetical protein
MITTITNLDPYIPIVRIHLGDVTGTQFSDNLVRTALVYGVKALGQKWSNRYFIFTSDMAISATEINTPSGIVTVATLPNEYDAFRNTYQPFTSSEPPVIEQTDETPLILMAALGVRKSVITSSMSAFTNWSTPDLSYSNVQASKSLMDMLSADQKALDDWFKTRLAKATKQNIPRLTALTRDMQLPFLIQQAEENY